MSGFPVFTRKWATDISFLTVARQLLSHPAPVYPQFATHNALTVASILEFAREFSTAASGRRYEFQRLHGMGDPLYDTLLADQPDVRVRVYAPVGEFRDLLAYLVRRLLENGANTSFVHQITDSSVPSDAAWWAMFMSRHAATCHRARHLPHCPPANSFSPSVATRVVSICNTHRHC